MPDPIAQLRALGRDGVFWYDGYDELTVAGQQAKDLWPLLVEVVKAERDRREGGTRPEWVLQEAVDDAWSALTAAVPKEVGECLT